MYELRDALRPSQEQVRRNYFEKDESGRTLYSPFGLDDFLARTRYVVPEDRIEEISRRHTRISMAATFVFAFIGLAAAGLMMTRYFDDFAQVFTKAPGLLLLLIFVAGVSPQWAPGWIVPRVLGPFEKAPAKTLGELAQHWADSLGTTRLVLACIGVATLIAWQAWIGVDAINKGHVGVGASILALALVLLPLVFVVPLALRMRRLKAENERLDAIVQQRTQELRELNRTLEQRVNDQVRDIERLGQLKHFFSAPVAEMILGGAGFNPAKVHRRELTAVSLDLRGFTAFSETSEPEEVISVLRLYHAELGIQVNRHQATLEHFAGDGVMLFFNDPIEVEDHPHRALELAVGLRDAMRPHLEEWRSHGFDIGLGIGIATGYATIGAVGYEGRWEYAAIGTVCNLAARLCAEAKDGQVIVSKRFMARIGGAAHFEALGERPLKGLARPVAMFNVVGLGTKVSAIA